MGITPEVRRRLIDSKKFLDELRYAKQILDGVIDCGCYTPELLESEGHVTAETFFVKNINVLLKNKRGIKKEPYWKILQWFNWMFKPSGQVKDWEVFLPLTNSKYLANVNKIGIYIFYSNLTNVELKFIESIFEKLSKLYELGKNFPKIEIKFILLNFLFLRPKP